MDGIVATLGKLTKEVKPLSVRMEDRQTKNGKAKTNPEMQSKVNTMHTTGSIYRPTLATTHHMPKPSKQMSPYHAPQPKNPMQPHHQSCLIIIMHSTELDQKVLHPRALVTFINNTLTGSEESQHIRVASAHYNQHQNLILMTREDQTGAKLLKYTHTFTHIFRVLEDTLELMTDDQRYKVQIDKVWTGEPGMVHIPEELLEELEYANPILKLVKLITNPKWIHSIEDLKNQDFSSIILDLSTEDDAM
ncbi:hypothetical protein C0989_004167 [Termitomyces sp. Mn162]|nr:hypothetical protein C0989_004167 [Termitomyces sp. Mn162]